VVDAFPHLQFPQVQQLLLRCWRELPSELKQVREEVLVLVLLLRAKDEGGVV
jgi:hypothetical protein